MDSATPKLNMFKSGDGGDQNRAVPGVKISTTTEPQELDGEINQVFSYCVHYTCSKALAKHMQHPQAVHPVTDSH